MAEPRLVQRPRSWMASGQMPAYTTELGIPISTRHHTATRGGAEILGIDAGIIAEGSLADLVLYDLHTPAFVPNFNFVSNLVYSANGYHADTLICDGRVLMENRHVEGEEEIYSKVGEVCRQLFA